MQGSLWLRCLRQLEGEVPEQQFNTWVRPLQAVEAEGVLRLLAPNRFVVDWVQQNLYSRIVDIAARESGGAARQVLVEVGSRSRPSEDAPVPAGPLSVPRRTTPAVVGGRVNPDFTFDTFIEGKSNQLARAAAYQVAENPGRAYNPLFIYGGVGLGKTHLLHAIGHRFLERNPGARVMYLTAETFINELINSIRYEPELGLTPPSPPGFEAPRDPSHGDVTTNVAMLLAKAAKRNPRQLAQEIVGRLAVDPAMVSGVEVAGPGFINFRIADGWYRKELAAILANEAGFGRSDAGRGKKAQVEFVSANPTGALTVGHGRNAVLGDTLANLLSWTGHEVEREYYFNDAGRQMRILGDSVRLRYLELLGRRTGRPPAAAAPAPRPPAGASAPPAARG